MKKKQEQLIIHTDADTLLEMFEILKEMPKEMDTEETRIKILMILGQIGRNVTMIKTGRSRKKIIEDLKKQYMNVQDLTEVEEDDKEKGY